MAKRMTMIGLVVALLAVAGIYLWGPVRVPQGQEPLLTLSSANFPEFQKAFDANAGSSRLVLLLSPT